MLAARVSALLARWGIEADDSAGRPLSQTAGGHLAAGDRCGGGRGSGAGAAAGAAQASVGRRRGRRAAGVARRGARARPRAARAAAGGRAGTASTRISRANGAWRARLARVGSRVRCDGDAALAAAADRSSPSALAQAADKLAGNAAWRGPDGRMAAELVAELQASARSDGARVAAEDAVPLLRQLFDGGAVRPPYGGHPRIFIWGLLEARLQQADLMVLGGLNEGVWPALAAPDPWLAPKIRRQPRAAGARVSHRPRRARFRERAWAHRSVLITRARRDSRSPTVASRFWLRLQAMTGGLRARHAARAAGRGARRSAACSSPLAGRAPSPPSELRPQRDLGHRRRPAEGRSVRFLCPGDARPAPRSIRSMPTTARRGKAPRSTRCSSIGSSRGRLRPGEACCRAPGRCSPSDDDPPDAARAVAAAADRGDPLDRRRKSWPTAPRGGGR